MTTKGEAKKCPIGLHKDRKRIKKTMWGLLDPPTCSIQLRLSFDSVNNSHQLGDLYSQPPSKLMERFQVRSFKTFISSVIHVVFLLFIALYLLPNNATTYNLSFSLIFLTYHFPFLSSLFLFNILFHLVYFFVISEKKKWDGGCGCKST
jgi:hypothetical protein